MFAEPFLINSLTAWKYLSFFRSTGKATTSGCEKRENEVKWAKIFTECAWEVRKILRDPIALPFNSRCGHLDELSWTRCPSPQKTACRYTIYFSPCSQNPGISVRCFYQSNAYSWRRFLSEELDKNPPEGFSAGLIDDDNLFKWEIMVVGPPDTF